MITAISTSGEKFVIEEKDGKTGINGQEMSIDKLLIKPGLQHWLIKNRSYTIELLEKTADKEVRVRVNGKVYTFQLKTRMDALLHELGMDSGASARVNDLKAPMPGLVVDVKVTAGQEIKKGDTIVVLEAMKMENALKATADATVKKIVAVKGAAVEKNQVLVYLS